MAQYEITKILDGPRNAVFHVAIAGDGVSEIEDAVLIDPATSFDPALPPVPSLTVDQLWYDLSGFTARLEFDYLGTDTPIWTMSDAQAGHMDFYCFGGIKDRSSEALGGLGKIKLTTSGLGSGDFGTMIVKLRKD